MGAAQCCMQTAVESVGTAIGDEARNVHESTTDKASRKLDRLSGKEEQEEPFDSAVNKIMAVGNDLVFHGKTNIEQQKREKVRSKNKKQMESIRNKYKPPDAPKAKSISKDDRQKYEDLKTRLGKK